MSIAEIVRKFDDRFVVPVDVNDVKAALIEMGVRDVIWFWAVDIDAEVLRGQLVHWLQKGEPASTGAFKGVADIYYAESLSRDWQRLVCCKELLHIIDPESALAATPEVVMRLTEKISLPPDLQNGVKDGMPALTDRVALLQATAVLFPWASRELFRKDGKLSTHQIAKLMDLPERYVAAVMDDDWELIHDIVVK